jgi:hypothetical protein
MTQLEFDSTEPRRETAVISKADRDDLLRMLEAKPAALIDLALRRSTFSDGLLGRAPRAAAPRRGARLPLLLGLLLCTGAVAYLVPHDDIARFIEEPRSVMGMTQSDVAKTAANARGEKYEVVLPRLSENVRNAVKNYVPEADGARLRVTCASLDAQLAPRSFSSQRAESAEAWIKRLDGLRKAGNIGTLPLELRKFAKAYPAQTVPANLQKFACVE